VRAVSDVVPEPLQPAAVARIDELVALHGSIITGNRSAGAIESEGREGRRNLQMVRRSILAMLLVVAAVLAGCSPGGSGGGGGSPAPTSQVAPNY
jgi:hypothetical protein